jgi:predicted DsbA family dithiol-disulfide isomerase
MDAARRPERLIRTKKSVKGSWAMRHELTIVSDVICPWCFVAKKNLEMALDLLPNGSDYSIILAPLRVEPRHA